MSLRNVDLHLLRAFDALMEERSVTRAAERLSLTQPAVSGILNRLRDVFADPLFVRTQRGITPTLRAQQLASPVKQILAEVDRLLLPPSFDPTQARFTVTLAATDYAMRAVVVPFTQALMRQAPGIAVSVRPLDEAHLLDNMERGLVDLALVTPQTAPPDLHAKTLFDERYVGVLRTGHPAGQAGSLSLDAFCSLQHGIVSLQGGGFWGATDEALAQQGKARHVAVSVPSFVMLLDLVRCSDIAALVPRRLLTDTQGLQPFEPPLPVPGFTKVMAWHARTHHDVGHQWVREIMARACIPLPAQEPMSDSSR